MKRGLSYLGAFVSLGFLVSSAAINYTFGFQMGRSPVEQQTLGAVAILAVAFNGLCPFYMQWGGNWLNRSAAALIWALCVTYTIASAIGFAAENRAASSGVSVALHDNLQTTKDMLGAELAKKKPDQRKVENYRKEMIGYRNKGAHVAPDNQSRLIAEITRLPEGHVRTGLVVFGGRLDEVARNIKLNSADPVALHGFTQLPNFILKNPENLHRRQDHVCSVPELCLAQRLVLSRPGHTRKGDRHERWQRQRLHQGVGELRPH